MTIELINQNLNNLALVILIIAITSLLIQLFYFFFIYRKALLVKPINKNNFEPVSIVICAKNEEQNLKQNIPVILNQQYPDFEVIVVNDGSTDNSIDVLAEFKQNYSNFNYTSIDENENFYHGKKLALTVGIKAAKSDLLILTDADCRPKSNKWIQKVANNFTEGINLVLGYGGYDLRKGFLNKLIQDDTLAIAMQYLGFAASGLPYMGVGRNIAYRKSFFINNNGFASHASIISGDDDLFVNEVATKTNTRITIDEESHTLSISKEKFSDWLNQKRRHLTTGKHYKTKDKLLLGLEHLSKLSFYISLILLIIIKSFVLYAIAFYLIRFLSQLTIKKLFMIKLQIKKILIFSPIFDILIPLMNLYLLFTSYLTQRNIKWK